MSAHVDPKNDPVSVYMTIYIDTSIRSDPTLTTIGLFLKSEDIKHMDCIDYNPYLLMKVKEAITPIVNREKSVKESYCPGYVALHGPLLLTWFNFNPSMDK